MIEKEMIEQNRRAFTEINHNWGKGCFPQIQLLDELHDIAPNSTFIFTFRPIHDWIKSMEVWGKPTKMFVRSKSWVVPGLQKFVDSVRTDHKLNLAKFWCSHTLHMREYVKEYPSHALIELDLYDKNGTESLMFDLFQHDAKPLRHTQSCWAKANANKQNN